MGNLATLQPAPPFTPETAKVLGKLGGERSGEVRRAKAKLKTPEMKLAEAQIEPAIHPEIHRIVKAMSKLKVTSDDYVRLAGVLERLWNKAWPTQGAVRGKPSKRDQRPIAQPVESPTTPTPQEKPM